MSTISVRKLNPVTREPQYGHGVADFITDIDAVAQIIMTTLLLLQGEFWEDESQGTPLLQSIIGVPGAGKKPGAVSLILQNRIRLCPFVTDILSIATTYNAGTRLFSFQCSVLTAFGALSLST